MSFEYASILWALLALPALPAAAWLAARLRSRAAGSIADPHLLVHVALSPRRGTVRWTRGLQFAALCLLLVGAARPVAAPPWPVNRATVVLAVDASRSMLADDVEPTRLDAALTLAERFVRAAPTTTRIGLVTFSDGAAALHPPTTDRPSLLAALDRVEPAQNTSVTAAVLAGVRLLPGREHVPLPPALAGPGSTLTEDALGAEPLGDLPPARIVLFSDGGDNVSPNPQLPVELALEVAARFAADLEVQVYAVPVGRDGGAISRIDGALYFVPFEREPLERLASMSGGRAVDATVDDQIAALFRELGRDLRWERTPTEVSVLFVAGAVLLMVVSGGLSLGWQRRVP